MKKTILLQLLLGWAAIAAAQTSTICHDDGTVTFKYKNDLGKREVLVYVQFSGRKAMQRDANGVWTATLGPAALRHVPVLFHHERNQ